ncbi:UDP binding domain-containing protein [Aquibium sp. ELW1220]|uniref:UDP binding domain-containing protein n=1 Tax=Aquibium sp. ELW1220 TaxID=2976766 RepID=UPI0025B14A51|nr:UDP binding domain-containing protein [Aquibium sp. ELW1220]MDN2583376.1 NAD(P)-binding domain-containing protein [Aquibium sp. ELW1220]
MNHEDPKPFAYGLFERLGRRTAVVGVIGLGYVGLPLAAACARGGFRTIGFDVDASKVEMLNGGRSYIDAVVSSDLAVLVGDGRFLAKGEFSYLAECDVVVICVPTPLTRHREPDLRYVTATAETIGILRLRGAHVDYHDPHVPVIPPTREHGQYEGVRSIEITAEALRGCHAVVVSTDHDAVDYGLVAEHSRLVIDTRNVFRRKGIESSAVVKS